MEKRPELKLQEVKEEYKEKDELGIPMSVRETYWRRLEKLRKEVRKKEHRKKLGQILLEKKLLSDEELREALTEQTESREDKLIGDVLLERGLITEEQLEKAIEEQVQKSVQEAKAS